MRIQGLRDGDGDRKNCEKLKKIAATDNIKKSNFLFKKYKKLYKMSNIFYINAKKLNFFVKFPVYIFK